MLTPWSAADRVGVPALPGTAVPLALPSLLLLCWIVVCASGARAAEAPTHAQDEPRRGYRALVQAYRAGQIVEAVSGLREIAPGDLRTTVQRLVQARAAASLTGGHLVDPALLQAAAVLHADAAAEAWGRGESERAGLHLECGAILVEALGSAGTPPGSFRQRWYLTTALVTARHADPAAAIDYFDRVTERVPGDAPLLTAAGWFAERMSFARADPTPARRLTVARDIPDTRRRQEAVQRRYQRLAVRWLNAAREASPSAPGPILRLARVEAFRGRDAEALALLSPLVARDDVPLLVAYVGRLLLGNLYERSGQTTEAERIYREAMVLAPPAQSARVALARLMYTTEPAAAAETVTGFLTSDADPGSNDPWADYQLAYLPLGSLLLGELRLEVGQ